MKHSTREHPFDAYRERAGHYDVTSRFAPVPGFPHRVYRQRAVDALRLRPGDTVVEVACGTGLNFPLLEQAVGPQGRLIGVDLSAAMLAQAAHRVAAAGWGNVSLVQADAAAFSFPAGVAGILATYPHALLPDPARVVGPGAAALRPGGRWVVLDVKIPDAAPPRLVRLGVATLGRSTALGAWAEGRPWEALRAAMQSALGEVTWTDLFLGGAYLATGTRRAHHVAAHSAR